MQKHELYFEELDNLKKFRKKLESHAIYKEDLDEFSEQYEELVAQAKVITRVSDRLQKKLDNANLHIRDQNDEIKTKNDELETTVLQLAKARVGRRASTIMLTVALGLFIAEQVFLEPIIEEKINIPYVGFGILAVLFFMVKALESGLENYFLNKEKKKIMNKEGKR